MALDLIKPVLPPLDATIKENLKKSSQAVAQIMAQVAQMEAQQDSMRLGIQMAKQAGHMQDAQPLQQQERMIQQRIDAGYHMLNEYWQYAKE